MKKQKLALSIFCIIFAVILCYFAFTYFFRQNKDSSQTTISQSFSASSVRSIYIYSNGTAQELDSSTADTKILLQKLSKNLYALSSDSSIDGLLTFQEAGAITNVENCSVVEVLFHDREQIPFDNGERVLPATGLFFVLSSTESDLVYFTDTDYPENGGESSASFSLDRKSTRLNSSHL